MMKVLRWLTLGLAALAAGLVVIAWLGSALSLDYDRQYSARTAALPLFTPGAASGLVRISANGYHFRARIAGFEADDQRPAVILLHGFPVTSAMWEPVLEPLVDAGYRVLAFDQRGYSPAARPEGKENYRADQLSDDLLAISEAVGLQDFHLVGHDWGAIVGWTTVLRYPERVNSWTGLSVPHPAAFAAAVQNDPEQRSRSGYFVLFQTPLVPEALFSFNNFNMLQAVYTAMGPAQRREYLAMFAEPGALTAAFNWYRAMGESADNAASLDMEVYTPTLFIWGNHDVAIARSGVQGQMLYIKGAYTEIELDAGHWLIEEHPEEITEALIQHLDRFSR
jgi:pimeloyl-ACP methyl ester carboxylesterase